MARKQAKLASAGTLPIGGGAPISVQSMLNVPADRRGRVALQAGGRRWNRRQAATLIRAAIPDHGRGSADSLRSKEAVQVPLVADIHFDYRLGAWRQRLPEWTRSGSIRETSDRMRTGSRPWRMACRVRKGIPIRIGGEFRVAGAAHPGEIRQRRRRKDWCESALYHASLLRKIRFDGHRALHQVFYMWTRMIRAYELCASEACAYPLHLGVTEAGTARMGLLKSAIGIGCLLQRGIGDTIRVSLTADPVEEVLAGGSIFSGRWAFERRREAGFLPDLRAELGLTLIALCEGKWKLRLAGCPHKTHQRWPLWAAW